MKGRNSFILLLILIATFIVFASAASNDVAWVGSTAVYNVSEDSLYNHLLANNITGTGANITFSVDESGVNVVKKNGVVIPYSSISSWIYIANSSNGSLIINSTNGTSGNQTGNFTIPIKVSWTNTTEQQNWGATADFSFNISASNDAPIFVGLQNKQMNSTSIFNYLVNVTDEENNTPFNFNISFVNCSTAEWSTRNSTNCTLFNASNYTFNNLTGAINISIFPERNDVGNYTVNFSATDSLGAVNNTLVIFQVLNINQAPYFRYICDNERNWSEGQNVLCYINVSDTDEINNVSIYSGDPSVISNPSITSFPVPGWFTFDGGSNNVSKNVNLSTNYNTSFLVNFTAIDNFVGNWSVNLTLTDMGSPVKVNSTLINFFINNTADNVSLANISNVTLAVTGNATFNASARDNDLLVYDKSVYNENLTFYSNSSWVVFSSKSVTSNTNLTLGTFFIYPNASLIGTHIVNISVFDKNNLSSDSKLFYVTVQNNSAPSWSGSTNANISINENSLLFLNLSSNVSDSDPGDNLTFSYTCSSCFNIASTFNLNSTTGIINFTPIDIDVGQFLYAITATDSKGANTTLNFNFTINNVNDNVTINRPLTNCSSAFSINSSNSYVITSEDNVTCIEMNVQDGDMAILQKSFYNEFHTLNQSSSPTFSLANFTLFNSGQTSSYRMNFTPGHSDIGNYTITLNITDQSGNNDSLIFNITVAAFPHAPVMDNISTQNGSVVESFSYDINSSDVEDGTDVNGTFRYSIRNLSVGGNFLSINSTSGLITNSSNIPAGTWNFSATVNDSTNLTDSKNFTLKIYDYPKIIYPSSSFNYSLAENSTYTLNFSVNHTIQDSLNYSFYINNILRNTSIGYGNATNYLINFTPNFTDETDCFGNVNLTLNVSNSKLTNSSSWHIDINRTNYPVTLISNIGEGNPLTLAVTNRRTINLTSYFYDLDATDSCLNQSINFSAQPLGSDTVSTLVTNWFNGSTPSITFSSGVAVNANYSVIATEYNVSNPSQAISNATSNNFTVSVDIETTTVTISGSGGGGGGTQTVITPVILKLLLPGPVNSDKKDSLSVPIKVTNSGAQTITGINLTSFVTFNGSNVSGITSRFDIPYIESLSQGESRNVTLFIESDVENQGNYEITINASANSPRISDWGKIYLNVKEGAAVERKILFADQLILDNPECAELTEIITSARADFDSGKINEAEKKIDEAINSCKRSIEQVGLGSRIGKVFGGSQTLTYVALLSVIAGGIGIIFYIYRRMKLRRTLMGYDQE